MKTHNFTNVMSCSNIQRTLFVQIIDSAGASRPGNALVSGSMSSAQVFDGSAVRVRPDGFQPMQVLVLDVTLDVSSDATVTLVINNDDFESV